MKSNQLIKNYATALFNEALAHKIHEGVFASLEKVEQVFCLNPEYSQFLSSPIVSVKDKIRIVKIVIEKMKIELLTQKFLLALVRNKRFGIFTNITSYYHNLLNESKNIKSIKVTSSKLLSLDEQHQVTKYLEELLITKSEIKFHVKAEIIGGLIIEYDNNLLDCSVIGSLNKIEKTIRGIS